MPPRVTNFVGDFSNHIGGTFDVLARVVLRPRHFLHDAIKGIAGFVRANLPSGFFEPLGLFLVLKLWAALLLFACFSHRASHLRGVSYVNPLPTMPFNARSARATSLIPSATRFE